MLRRTTSLPFLRREVGRYQPGGDGVVGQNPIYQSLRHHSRFHEHITYNRLGALRKPRKPLVDPKDLKVGEPVSASILLGDMVTARKFEFDVRAMNARGFLRFQKPYTPPDNAMFTVLELCKSCLNITGDEVTLMRTELRDSRKKFDLLAKAFDTFQHAVPNSMLHMMATVGDIVNFYNTPIKTTTPYEELVRRSDLPPNLHIQKDPVRFHPETDTMFGGVSAFPKSSTIVTGLRAKKVYRGYEAKMTWP